MSRIIFITGGVRSGKSAFAEEYAIKLYEQHQQKLYYLASGVGFDEEMKKRISRHQEDRKQSQMPWETIEIQNELPSTNFHSGDIILWDCLTTWLNNIFYITELMEHGRVAKIHHFIDLFKTKVMEWKKERISVLLVSNELLDEPPSIYQEVNFYRAMLGYLHQWVVSICDEAYELDYGISIRKK